MNTPYVWEATIAAVGLFTALITAVYALRRSRLELSVERARLETATASLNQMELEVKFQAAALDFAAFLAEWDSIHAEVMQLFETTEIDRFTIFRAWNGKLTPRWTTALLQIRKAGQHPVSYVHYELDRDYLDRLTTITGGKMLSFTTKQAAGTDIGEIYGAEGVTASIWGHIESLSVPDSPSKAITYCSFSTHDSRFQDEVIPKSTEIRCQLLLSRLKGIATQFTLERG